ncbi:hypothetical protein IAT40_004526 [Kwoniella sp. CBS 6097]
MNTLSRTSTGFSISGDTRYKPITTFDNFGPHPDGTVSIPTTIGVYPRFNDDEVDRTDNTTPALSETASDAISERDDPDPPTPTHSSPTSSYDPYIPRSQGSRKLLFEASEADSEMPLTAATQESRPANIAEDHKDLGATGTSDTGSIRIEHGADRYDNKVECAGDSTDDQTDIPSFEKGSIERDELFLGGGDSGTCDADSDSRSVRTGEIHFSVRSPIYHRLPPSLVPGDGREAGFIRMTPREYMTYTRGKQAEFQDYMKSCSSIASDRSSSPIISAAASTDAPSLVDSSAASQVLSTENGDSDIPSDGSVKVDDGSRPVAPERKAPYGHQKSRYYNDPAKSSAAGDRNQSSRSASPRASPPSVWSGRFGTPITILDTVCEIVELSDPVAGSAPVDTDGQTTSPPTFDEVEEGIDPVAGSPPIYADEQTTSPSQNFDDSEPILSRRSSTPSEISPIVPNSEVNNELEIAPEFDSPPSPISRVNTAGSTDNRSLHLSVVPNQISLWERHVNSDHGSYADSLAAAEGAKMSDEKSTRFSGIRSFFRRSKHETDATSEKSGFFSGLRSRCARGDRSAVSTGDVGQPSEAQPSRLKSMFSINPGRKDRTHLKEAAGGASDAPSQPSAAASSARSTGISRFFSRKGKSFFSRSKKDDSKPPSTPAPSINLEISPTESLLDDNWMDNLSVLSPTQSPRQ